MGRDEVNPQSVTSFSQRPILATILEVDIIVPVLIFMKNTIFIMQTLFA